MIEWQRMKYFDIYTNRSIYIDYIYLTKGMLRVYQTKKKKKSVLKYVAVGYQSPT